MKNYIKTLYEWELLKHRFIGDGPWGESGIKSILGWHKQYNDTNDTVGQFVKSYYCG